MDIDEEPQQVNVVHQPMDLGTVEDSASADDNSDYDDESVSAEKQPDGNKFKFDKVGAQKAKDKLENQKVKDTLDRYKFLLGQSELFSHFIKAKGIVAALNVHADSSHLLIFIVIHRNCRSD